MVRIPHRMVDIGLLFRCAYLPSKQVPLDQCCQRELPVITESSICVSNTVVTNHMWALSMLNVAGEAEALNFYFI